MAIIQSSWVDLSQKFYGNIVVLYTWANLANGDSGLPVQGPGWADRTFQLTGTFGSGGTCVIEGSNDGVNYAVLDDPFGNPMSFTTAVLKQLIEIPLWVRPRVSVGDGTTSLTITGLFGRHGLP